jgi:hypothetical protein
MQAARRGGGLVRHRLRAAAPAPPSHDGLQERGDASTVRIAACRALQVRRRHGFCVAGCGIG